MALKFSVDPQTGVIVPPVTVFNGGKRSGASAKRSVSKRKVRKTRKSKRKTQRRRR